MPRTKQSIEKLKDDRRQEILRISLRLFALNGYDATSINDIAKAVGCSHGLIYHYFDDKDAIFTTLLDQSLKLGYMPLFPNLEEAQLQHPKDTLEDIVAHIFGELNKPKSDFAHYFYLFLNMRFQKRAPMPRFHVPQASQRPFAIIKSLVEAGQSQDIFSKEDARDLAISFFSLMRGLTYVKLHDGAKFALPSVPAVMNMFLRKAELHV